MEVLGATASIVGIITFACKALSAIDDIKAVCAEFSDKAAEQFLHDLEVTADVLVHAKALAEEAQLQGPQLKLKYRAGALNVQIDDCAQDLEEWLRIAVRMRTVKSGQKQAYTQTLFNRMVTAFSKSSRTKARDKLRWHRENIDTTLSIFGRSVKHSFNRLYTLKRDSQLDLINAGRIQNLQETLSDTANSVEKQISDLSSSISSSTGSIRAQNSDTSQKLDVITKLIQQLLPPKTAALDQDAQEAYSHNNLHAERTELIHRPDIEFELLYDTVASTTDMLRRRYTPQLSELLATVQAWKITTYYESCLGLELTSDIQADTSDYTSRDIAFQAELRRLRRIIASRLFTARRTLFSEGLGDTFDVVTKKLHIEHIWSDAREANVYGHRTLKKQLAMCQPRNPEEGRQDKLTSLNEWLLETFMAIPWHQELYVSLCTSYLLPSVLPPLWYIHKFANGDMTYQNGLTFDIRYFTSLHIRSIKSDGSLLRQCIKFWFLDTASMLQEAVAPSTIATSDSDATFRPTRHEAIPTSIELVSEHSKINTAIHLVNPKCSLLKLDYFKITGWMDEDVELPPNNVSQEDLARAATALKEYQGLQSSPLMGDERSEFS